MANAKGIRTGLEREFAKLSKACESVEASMKSAADDVITAALAVEKVLEKEIAPSIPVALRGIEKELAAYKRAAEKDLAKLTKAYSRELAKLRKAKGRVEKKASTTTKAKPAAKRPTRAKPKTAPKSSTRAQAKPAPKKPTRAKTKPAARTSTRKSSAKRSTARTSA